MKNTFLMEENYAFENGLKDAFESSPWYPKHKTLKIPFFLFYEKTEYSSILTQRLSIFRCKVYEKIKRPNKKSIQLLGYNYFKKLK